MIRSLPSSIILVPSGSRGAGDRSPGTIPEGVMSTTRTVPTGAEPELRS